MWRHTEMRTIPDIIRHWGPTTPDKVALAEGEAVVTYGQLQRRSNQVAQAILGHTIAPRSHVGFVGKNSTVFWDVWFGATKAGCGFAPLNFRYTAAEMAELLADAQIALVVVDRDVEATVRTAAERCGHPVELVVFDTATPPLERLRDWIGAQPEDDPAVPATGTDTALLAYTSGTTGRPKGVQIMHEAFDLSALSDELEPSISWSADDVLLMVMPNFHLAGSWVSVPALYHNGSVAIVPGFEPTAVLDAIGRHRPTVMCLVPAAIQVMVDHPGTATTDFGPLHTLIYAGSAIGQGTLQKALETFRCDMRQFYGTTEAYIITLLRAGDHDLDRPERLASCGSPIPLVEMRVVDEDGTDVEQGSVGQFIVRSPMAFAGYYNQPDETAATLREGWYWTGDLGYCDADGYYFIVDRVKDMVVTGGENVYSVEVERALARHPDVAMVAVIGTPDPKWGEAVTAFVVPVPGAELDPEALRVHCRELIAGYKVPKVIHIEESLPVTPSGKVKKPELRKR